MGGSDENKHGVIGPMMNLQGINQNKNPDYKSIPESLCVWFVVVEIY